MWLLVLLCRHSYRSKDLSLLARYDFKRHIHSVLIQWRELFVIVVIVTMTIVSVVIMIMRVMVVIMPSVVV